MRCIGYSHGIDTVGLDDDCAGAHGGISAVFTVAGLVDGAICAGGLLLVAGGVAAERPYRVGATPPSLYSERFGPGSLGGLEPVGNLVEFLQGVRKQIARGSP
jgi:hypothetical protein